MSRDRRFTKPMLRFRDLTPPSDGTPIHAGLEWERGSTHVERLIEFLSIELGKRVRIDSGVGIKAISATATHRLVRMANQYALTHRRQSVTLVHTGNFMKHTDGAFRDWGYELAKEEFGDVTVTEGQPNSDAKVVIKDRIADTMLQQILTRTSDYDVIATTNLNGDYLSEACAAQVGGVGLAPGRTSEARRRCLSQSTAPRQSKLGRTVPTRAL